MFAYKLSKYKAQIDKLDADLNDDRYVFFDLKLNNDREFVKRLLELNQLALKKQGAQ